MIAHLSGKVRRAGPDFVVVDVGGVGYMVSVSTTTRQKVPAPGGEVDLDIHTHVREDQLGLYGFASVEELDLFEMLIQVDGVGPKVGLNILSAASLEVLKRAIMSEDAAWTKPLDTGYEECLPKIGLKVLDHIRFSPDTTDFTPIFNKIEGAKPDVIDYELGSENRQGEPALSRTAPPWFVG